MSSESTETIGVYVRVRSSESAGACVQVSPTTGEITALRAPRPGEASPEAVHSFRFDQVGDAGTDQAAVFEAVGRPIADAALAGFNATVFAFGQTGAPGEADSTSRGLRNVRTGHHAYQPPACCNRRKAGTQKAGTCGPYVPESQESLPPDPTHCTHCTYAKHLPASGVLHIPGAGKSYTMFGAEHGAQRGLAPRMLEQLLARVEHGCRCRCTAVEIHNESLSDLLAPSKPAAEREPHQQPQHTKAHAHAHAPPPLRLREDAARGVYVASVTSLELTSPAQAAG